MKTKQMMLSIGLSLLLVGGVITIEVLTNSDGPKIANADTTDTLLVPEKIVSNTETPDTTIDSPIETLVADIAEDVESLDFEQLNIDPSAAEFLVMDQVAGVADSITQSSSSASGSINDEPIVIIASSPYASSSNVSSGSGGGGDGGVSSSSGGTSGGASSPSGSGSGAGGVPSGEGDSATEIENIETDTTDDFTGLGMINTTGASVKVISSLERLLQNEVVVEGTEGADIFCAKNEYESFQIIIANPKDIPVLNIDLKSDNWHFVGTPGNTVPELTLYREHYVEITKPSPRSTAVKGWYPDALVPFIDPYTDKNITRAKYLAADQDVLPNSNQGYWVDVYVPIGTKAGDYTNKITVLSEGKIVSEIPIKLTVWDFELPETHKFKSFFYGMRDVSSYHNLNYESSAYKVIEKRYENYLRDHGLTLEFKWSPAPVIRGNGQLTFKPSYVKRLKAYIDRMQPSVFRIKSLFPFQPEALATYLSGWERFLSSNPNIPQAIVYYDEPSSMKSYKKLLTYGQAIKKYSPHIKFLITEQIKPQEPDFPSLEGVVDIWVPLWHLANPEDIKRRQLLGDEAWSYVALTQSAQTPTWLIDFPVLNYRIPAWFSWSLDLKGILYWSTASWGRQDKQIDPWKNPAYTAGGRVWNGEGSLFYPGHSAGIAGPVGSMRLKVIRDSFEDYDYFSILSDAVGLEESRKWTSKVASEFKKYSKNPADYLETRKAIADAIQKDFKR